MVQKLKEFKQRYSKLQKKYSLPSFNELNENFEIEKIAKNETEFLLREIKGSIIETYGNFIRAIESFLNPSTSSFTAMVLSKYLDSKHKEKLNKIRLKILDLEIFSMKLIEYSEKKEAEFIKKANKLWKEIKKEFLEVVEFIESKKESKKEEKIRAYFG